MKQKQRMGVVHIMAQISMFKLYRVAILLCAALAVFIFYYLGSEKENVTTTIKRITENQAVHQVEGEARFSVKINESFKSNVILSKEQEAKVFRKKGVAYHAIMMFTKVDRNQGLQEKFKTAMKSLIKYCKLDDNEVLHLHFVSDFRSKEYGESVLDNMLHGALFKHKVTFHDVNALTEKLFPIVEAMQKHFSAGSGTYYSDSIFFLSVAMHRIMPEEITRILQLDLDVKYRTNIRELFEEFDKFPSGAVIGIAREMQPVYRHTFWQYRRDNLKTKVGDPPPDGLPGFNSGVMLLNLEAMRESKLYNQLLESEMVHSLTKKYHFKGHLGDQDFFTMVGMEHKELFYVLECVWNRQLCTWWKDNGYNDVFDLYFKCDGDVRIYHGNCNTPIPEN